MPPAATPDSPPGWLVMGLLFVIILGFLGLLALNAQVVRWHRRRRARPASRSERGGLTAAPSTSRPEGRPTAQHAPARPTGATLRQISLGQLAAGTTILIVGSRRSGKSVLLRAIVGLKQHASLVFDPHDSPGKWPANTAVAGGGSDYAGVYRALLRMLEELSQRSEQLRTGQQREGDFSPILVAADEWGSVVEEAARGVAKGQPMPGECTIRLLKEGGKFGIEFVAGAHGDTAASLGSEGDTKAFQQSFDYIVYTGAYVREKLHKAGAGHLYAQLPIGRTPQGNEFPLIVPVYRPTSGDWLLLDMRPAMQAPTMPRPALDLELSAPAGAQADDAPAPAASPALTIAHLQVAQWVTAAAPSVRARVAGGEDWEVAWSKVLSGRQIARKLGWNQEGGGGGTAGTEATRLRREVEAALGLRERPRDTAPVEEDEAVGV